MWVGHPDVRRGKSPKTSPSSVSLAVLPLYESVQGSPVLQRPAQTSAWMPPKAPCSPSDAPLHFKILLEQNIKNWQLFTPHKDQGAGIQTRHPTRRVRHTAGKTLPGTPTSLIRVPGVDSQLLSRFQGWEAAEDDSHLSWGPHKRPGLNLQVLASAWPSPSCCIWTVNQGTGELASSFKWKVNK